MADTDINNYKRLRKRCKAYISEVRGYLQENHEQEKRLEKNNQKLLFRSVKLPEQKRIEGYKLLGELNILVLQLKKDSDKKGDYAVYESEINELINELDKILN